MLIRTDRFELEVMGRLLLPEGVFLKVGRWERYVSREGLRVTIQ